jgi:hypothetical protein
MTLRTRRRKFGFSFFCIVGAAVSLAAGLVACLQDFGTFEGALADAAEAARSDVTPATLDDGATDFDAGPDASGPCVQAPLACLTPRGTCRTGCQTDLGMCLGVCQDGGPDADTGPEDGDAGDGGPPRSCEEKCRDTYNGCNGACNLTCLDCSGPCSAGCLSNE